MCICWPQLVVIDSYIYSIWTIATVFYRLFMTIQHPSLAWNLQVSLRKTSINLKLTNCSFFILLFSVVGVGPKVSMVSCGADKSIYFRSAEKVNRLSLSCWDLFYIACHVSRYHLYCFALTVWMYHCRLLKTWLSLGHIMWLRKVHYMTWTWTPRSHTLPLLVKTATLGSVCLPVSLWDSAKWGKFF